MGSHKPAPKGSGHWCCTQKIVQQNMMQLLLFLCLSPLGFYSFYIVPSNPYITDPASNLITTGGISRTYFPVSNFRPGFGYSFGPGYDFRWNSLPIVQLSNNIHDVTPAPQGATISSYLKKVSATPFKNSKLSPLLVKLQNSPTGRQTGIILA